MLAAEAQKRADKVVAAVPIVITAAGPVSVGGEKLDHQVKQLHRFGDFRFGRWSIAPDPGTAKHRNLRAGPD